MQSSSERILTTHVGSLPRPQRVVDQLMAQDAGESYSEQAFDAVMAEAVAEVVARQVEVGIDVVSDGEMSKISYATYIRHRLTGFEIGEMPRAVPRDLDDFPDYKDRLARLGATPKYHRPICCGDIAVKDLSSLEKDIANLKAAGAAAGQPQLFMNAASPGVVAVFQPNRHYPSQEAYIGALADAMKAEYDMIVAAGLILQIDSPDLAMGRHIRFRDVDDAEFLRNAALQVEALNHALRDVPAERVRMHICWGNYEGPHTHDIPLEKIVGLVLKAKPQAYLLEASNPRHAHEWAVWAKTAIPDDKVLVPGVIDSVTNFVEHPDLVAERICRYADIVGRERVIAGTDCGFGTFAGFGAIHPPIAYAKLGSLVEGARIASRRLWRRSAA
ncbi:MAG TPA: cobalamin-independent methionine synthase II family protein [Geminicoccaceae bacterium]|nr:cobalamin-independent methionine synthase II family protein [Geminicoccus sp.]HMU49024.1 cobalamin-independent methionine synthase II family protein [Geminicoccaceae bacterium]